ncbi:MAG: hypothetical protein K0R73_912 [Candidatus Midichloriaceae bacterium]|nr:hypothetical protein [Candidatus Midichloriaceae bacterium]
MTSDRHTFFNYPFPKNLLVDIKRGYYKVLGVDGAEEVIEADNAKDALSKTKIVNISKIEYMGFCAKKIVDAKELIEGNEIETEEQEESVQSPEQPPETNEKS